MKGSIDLRDYGLDRVRFFLITSTHSLAFLKMKIPYRMFLSASVLLFWTAGAVKAQDHRSPAKQPVIQLAPPPAGQPPEGALPKVKSEIIKPEKNSPGHVFITRKPHEAAMTETFDCKDTVYVLLSGITQRGSHKFEVYWNAPDGKRQEYSKSLFTVDSKSADVYVWLEVQPGTGGKLFSAIDPTAGLEGSIGRWNVKVYMDEKMLADRFFYIAC